MGPCERANLAMATDPTTPNVSLTEAAADAFNGIVDDQGYEDAAMKVAVAPGGCGGWEYQLGIARRPTDTDLVTESLGVTLFVDSMTLPLFEGAVIDFSDGLMGQGFSVSNPLSKADCSCGQSFKTTGGAVDEGACSSAVAGN